MVPGPGRWSCDASGQAVRALAGTPPLARYQRDALPVVASASHTGAVAESKRRARGRRAGPRRGNVTVRVATPGPLLNPLFTACALLRSLPQLDSEQQHIGTLFSDNLRTGANYCTEAGDPSALLTS
jgi:hypothetical protein